MITFIILFFMVCTCLYIGFLLTGALLAAFIWVFVKIPLGIMVFTVGLCLCCTILLIPLGLGCMKAGLRLLLPGI